MRFMYLKRSAGFPFIASILLTLTTCAFGAGDVHLVFTADTQGHVGPCQSCPGEKGLGGLARRATLLAELRRREQPLLLVDAGNAFFGDQSLSSGGKVIAAAYDALHYDAVNISYR